MRKDDNYYICGWKPYSMIMIVWCVLINRSICIITYVEEWKKIGKIYNFGSWECKVKHEKDRVR